MKPFRSGPNQLLHIPRESELPGEGAVVGEGGHLLIVEPASPRSLLALLATLEPFDEEFPLLNELPHEPVGFYSRA